MRHLISLIIALAAATAASAQRIDSLFAAVPESVCPMLDRNTRLDMLDLYDYNMKAKGDNIFGGESVMTYKSDALIRISLTPVSRWELLLLKNDTATVIASIHTIQSPAAESRLTLYDTAWRPLPVPPMPELAIKDFMSQTDSTDTDSTSLIAHKLQLQRPEMTWEETANGQAVLRLSISTAALGLEDRKAAAACLRPVFLEVVPGPAFKRR